MPPRQLIKKAVSINDVESKLSFKKIPIIQKTTSLQDHVAPYPSREGYTSLRIIWCGEYFIIFNYIFMKILNKYIKTSNKINYLPLKF